MLVEERRGDSLSTTEPSHPTFTDVKVKIKDIVYRLSLLLHEANEQAKKWASNNYREDLVTTGETKLDNGSGQ